MEGIVISKDQTGKNQIELIPYKVIKCVNPLGRNSFFFKSNKNGYALLFHGFIVENAMKWFEAMIILIDKDVQNKEEIKILDITENYGAFNLESEVLRFDYSFTKALKHGLDKMRVP